MSGEHDSNTTIVIPLALTDFAKALRELIAAFRDAGGIGRDGVDLIRRRRAGTAAANLDHLSFQPDGFCRHLRALADGTGTEDDTAALDRFYDETSTSVAKKIETLREYRAVVREQCGRAAADQLSGLIDGPNGKFVIRYEIAGLIRLCRNGKDVESISGQAIRILDMIAIFNDQLTRVHDTIFPPRGAPR